jgi:hypothetical protein
MAQAFVVTAHGTIPNRGRFRSLLPVGIVVAVAIGAAVALYPILVGDQTGSGTSGLTTAFSFAIAVMLGMMPAVICTVQNVSLRRQRGELDALEGTSAADTTLYATAQRTIRADAGDSWLDNDYVVPNFVYFLVCFVGFLAIFLGYSRYEMFDLATIFLGGLTDPASDTYTMYQRGTFCVIAMAMAGAYAYTLGRILDRINNNDLYPVSLYYYAVRIIIACIVAAVLRHSVLAFDAVIPEGTQVNPLLLLLGFIVGFTRPLYHRLEPQGLPGDQGLGLAAGPGQRRDAERSALAGDRRSLTGEDRSAERDQHRQCSGSRASKPVPDAASAAL